MPDYTDMGAVFAAIGEYLRHFNWLVTGGLHYSEFASDAIVSDSGDAIWLNGIQLGEFSAGLHRIVDWGVFSGFSPSVRLDVNDLAVYPIADGNPLFWVANPVMQHPLAEVEIVCFDRGLTLLFSKDQRIEGAFRSYFPEQSTWPRTIKDV
jgi:hypothetical protein